MHVHVADTCTMIFSTLCMSAGESHRLLITRPQSQGAAAGGGTMGVSAPVHGTSYADGSDHLGLLDSRTPRVIGCSA